MNLTQQKKTIKEKKEAAFFFGVSTLKLVPEHIQKGRFLTQTAFFFKEPALCRQGRGVTRSSALLKKTNTWEVIKKLAPYKKVVDKMFAIGQKKPIFP